MLCVGSREIDRIAKVIRSGRLFRYRIGRECETFERRYAKFLNVRGVCMTASGTHALTAALQGLSIGPGDEVLVPAHTYMASAVSVLSVGAIPVIVDIDESLLIDPAAVDDAVGPRTKAVMPVHMWGHPCDMRALLRIARKHKILVIEDACQGAGGAYEGKMLGSMGHAGAFSFNYYKNMTCGEGGAVATGSAKVLERVRCAVDSCNYYWTGRTRAEAGFASNGARASELHGAMMNVQLGRIRSLIRACRSRKQRILKSTADCSLTQVPLHSPKFECGTHVMFSLPIPTQADSFAAAVRGTVVGKTGRHVYTEWDAVLDHRGAHHPAMNPFAMKANRGCRMDYSPDMCARSLEILNRTVMIAIDPDADRAAIDRQIRRIHRADQRTLG